MGQEGSKEGNSENMATGPLNSEQLNQLPIPIKDILLQYFNDQASYQAELKSKFDRLCVDSEQKCFSLEQQHRSDQEKLETESKISSDLHQQVADLEKRYNEISEKYREIQSTFFEKEKFWNFEEQKLLRTKTILESEKADLSELLNQRNYDVDRLTAEWKQMSEKLNETTKLRLASQASADQASSELVIIQNRENRMVRELEQVRQQNDLLNQELQARFNEIMNIRKDKSTQLIDLQSQLDDVISQANHSTQSLEQSKKIQSEQAEQIETYITKLRETKDAHIQMEEQYRSELLAQEKLINLYKVSAEEAESKMCEMMKAVEELQKLLTQATEAYNNLKESKESDEKELEDQLFNKGRRIEQLENELVHANQLLESMKKKTSFISNEELEVISPAAAAASRLLKSGMSLTQIYSEYVDTMNALQQEKEENRRITDYLDRILQEIEEKAPLIKQQKEDYEKCLETNERLTHQLDGALLEGEKCRVKSDENYRRCCELSRENERYSRQTRDLSLQVRMLLKELEEERGTTVRMPNEQGKDFSNELSSSSFIISEKLVTFRSIEELQQKNMQLLEVVRELSSASEEREEQTKDDRSDVLQKQLDSALEEISELKASRERQAELVESIIHQRDMFRTMLSQTASSPNRPVESPVHTRTPAAAQSSPRLSPSQTKLTLNEQDQKTLDETKQTLTELHEEFSMYRREKCENEKILSEQLDSMRKELSDHRLQSAKFASQLDFSNERYKVLQSNVEAHKKEAEACRVKSQKLSDSVVKHQQTIAMLREEIKSNQERIATAEVRCNSLLAEREMLKGVEVRLKSELDSVRKDQQSRDVLLSNLQSIQNNLERSDFEVKTKLNTRIDTLERENAILRKKANGTEDQQKSFVYSLERQLTESRADVSRQEANVKRLNEQLTSAEQHIQHLNGELTSWQTKFAAAEAKLAESAKLVHELQEKLGPNRKLEEDLKDSKAQLSQAQADIKDHLEKLNQMEQHSLQYKSIAASLEASLREQNVASKQFKESLELQLIEARRAKDLLESQMKEIEIERLRIVEENSALCEEMQKLVQEKDLLQSKTVETDSVVVEQITKVQQELEEALASRDQALANERSARKDCMLQADEAREAHSNYERELVLHAADVEMLTSVKQELENYTTRLADEQKQASEAIAKLEIAQAVWMEQEQNMKKELVHMKDRVVMLQTQNTTLHEELEKVSERMLQIQSHQENEDLGVLQMAESVEKEGEKSADQLLEVIRFLRREKEIAEAKYEGLQAETNRLRQQTTQLSKQLDSTEEMLIQERDRIQVNLETAAQHAELMRKVETMNLLQDSNQLLREEKDRMVVQIKESKAKVVELDTQLAPLQDHCQQLEAERDVLQKEIEMLKDEVDRWKARTNRLVEQCNKFDPEELKKAIEDRNEAKGQLKVAMEENQKLRNELSRISTQLAALQVELNESKQSVQSLSEELNSAKSANATNEAESEEKNKTIAQLRKIGRKYRMQAEEVQKELDELKAKGNQADLVAEIQEKLTKSEAEIKQQQEKMKKMEKEVEEVTGKLVASEFEKNEAWKNVKEVEMKEKLLLEQIVKLKDEMTAMTQERGQIANENVKAADEKEKILEENRKMQAENESLKEENSKFLDDVNRLNEENKKMAEEKKENEQRQKQTRNIIQTAKQKIGSQKAEIERLTGECEELKKKLETDQEEITKLTTEANDLRQQIADQSMGESDSNQSVQVSRYEERISNLVRERDVEVAQKLTEVESCEKLRRENQELKQRVGLMQRQIESLQKQIGQIPAKPIVTAPPVERTCVVTTETPQRRANIRPMTTQSSQPQRYSTPVQPVRSTAEIRAETRAMVASIRPMAVASTQPMLMTPMATVMPTTMSSQENEGLPMVVLSQSVITSQQQGTRPTQQVQPVSSHFEESTVSSSEEPSTQQEGLQPSAASWWQDPAIPSTSSEHANPSSAGISGIGGAGAGATGKRQREEARNQEESTEPDNEAPVKRSKMQIGEAADTTQSTSSAVMVTEVEREAASMAQPADAQQEDLSTPRRELEPVTTSLEELIHGSYTTQEDDSRKNEFVDQMEGLATHPLDDLPDYQEPEASVEYDIRPSTSRQPGWDIDEQSNQESTNQSEPRDESEEQMSYGILMPEGDGGQDEDVIVLEDDEGNESEVVLCTEGEEYQDVGSGDEVEEGDAEYQNIYQEDIEEEESEGEEKNDGMDDIYVDLDSKATDEVEGDVGSDVIIVDDEAGNIHDRSLEGDSFDQEGESLASSVNVSTSRPTHSQTRHITPAVMRSSFPPPSGECTRSTNILMTRHPAPVERNPVERNPMLASTSRSQLMPFMFASEMGGAFEIGDDGIVPSTPTLQMSGRTDGFAEAVNSPQVNENFMFSSVHDSVQHSELAQQRGLGVDDTKMDLSQFDEAAARSSTAMPSNVPTIAVLHASPEHLSQLESGDGEPSDEKPDAGDQQPSASGQDAAGIVAPPSTSGQSVSQSIDLDEDVDDIQSEQTSESGNHPAGQDDRPSTSDGGAQDRLDMQSQGKPKIQRIVWDEPAGGGRDTSPVSGHLIPGSSQQMAITIPTASSSGRRGYGSYRGHSAHQHMGVRPLLQPHGGVIPLLHENSPQVARRARGARGGVGNNVWSSRQQHF